MKDHWFGTKGGKKERTLESVFGWGHGLSLDDDGCFSSRTYRYTKEWRDVYPVQITDANVELCKRTKICLLWAFVFKLLHYKFAYDH